MINRIGRTKRGNIVISTVKPSFMAWYGKYETAVSFDNQNHWRIAEGYETEDEAIKGHEKYCHMTDEELNNIHWID